MMTKVLKPFNTRHRRFAADSEVPEGADLAPHNAAHLTERGFLEGAAPEIHPWAKKSRTPEPATEPEPIAETSESSE